MNQNLTREQYDKLKIECETYYGGKWYKGKKFVRRGRNYVVVAFLANDGTPLMSSYSCGNVRIDGNILDYYKYITNTKRPEPFRPEYLQQRS